MLGIYIRDEVLLPIACHFCGCDLISHNKGKVVKCKYCLTATSGENLADSISNYYNIKKGGK